MIYRVIASNSAGPRLGRMWVIVPPDTLNPVLAAWRRALSLGLPTGEHVAYQIDRIYPRSLTP